MKIWTTSYGLVSAGWACLMFMLFYWVIDFRGNRKWALPFVVIGSNAIFIYMFTSLIPLGTWVHIFTRQVSGEWANLEPLLSAVLALTVEWLILFWMYKRKIFIKA
jgi:predicted acyltransferase